MSLTFDFRVRPEETQQKIQQSCRQHGEHCMDALSRCDDRKITELTNMWPGRAQHILTRLQSGDAITASFRYDPAIYDTTGWHEIVSRLCRARGLILKIAARVYWHRDLELPRKCNPFDCIGDSLWNIHLNVRGIAEELCHFTPIPNASEEIERPAPAVPFDPRKQSLRHAASRVSQAGGLIAKCLHDIPRIPTELGVAPTTSERARITVEAARIDDGASLLRACAGCSVIQEPEISDESYDPFGIGSPYAKWLSSFHRDWQGAGNVTVPENLDSLVARWLFRRFLDLETRREFVRRALTEIRELGAEYLLALSDDQQITDDDRYVNVSKFERNATCATKLVFAFLRFKGLDVNGLVELIEAVEGSDAVGRCDSSNIPPVGGQPGLHAHTEQLRRWSSSETVYVNAIEFWLDAYADVANPQYRGPASETPIF